MLPLDSPLLLYYTWQKQMAYGLQPQEEIVFEIISQYLKEHRLERLFSQLPQEEQNEILEAMLRKLPL